MHLINIDEKLRMAKASNDQSYAAGEAVVSPALQDATQFVESCRHMLDAPSDLPASDRSLLGLANAIRALSVLMPAAAPIAERVIASIDEAAASAAKGATVLSLQRRTGRHLLYALAIQIGDASQKSHPLDETAMVIFGAWCTRRLLEDSHPTSSAIAKLRAVLVRPSGTNAIAWSATARARAKALSLRNLTDAIAKNEKAAAFYGLRANVPRLARAMDPVSIANRLFRRRTENLVHFSCKDAVAGAGGHGTLSAAGLKSAGRELMAGVKAGDKKSALACLEVITHLPSKTLLKVPLQIGQMPPTGALAWLNPKAGCYCQTLYKVIERGARPNSDTEHLYEPTVQVVTVFLSPPLRMYLSELFAASGGTASCVEELLGAVAHDPNSAVAGSGIYRYTARRLQESLSAYLLERGYHRWPVALATNSMFLVSMGRPSYGACKSTAIHAVVAASCHLLGWPTPIDEDPEQLVGSFTTPKPSSVSSALNFLAAEADTVGTVPHDFQDAIAHFNRHAQWMAMFMALSFALRSWVAYALPSAELRVGENVHFDDKYVHAQKGPGVPIAPLVFEVIKGWYAFCRSFGNNLAQSTNPQSRELARTINDRLADESSVESIFGIDAVGRLEPVGSSTWERVLPRSLRLRSNYPRHFWPMQLAQRAVEQQLIDILMRHQIAGLHSGASHSVKRVAEACARLRSEMNYVLISLGLRIPVSLRCPDHEIGGC